MAFHQRGISRAVRRSVVLTILLLIATTLIQPAYGQAQRPLQLADILAWKRIQSPAVSNNGEWFAYSLAPAEGEARVIVRNLKSGKEQSFPAGDRSASASDGGGAPSPMVMMAGGDSPAFSADSRWVAFHAYPGTKEAKQLKKSRKPIQTKVVLVELATGKKVEFEKTERFAFAGEKATAIALKKYAPASAGPPSPPPAAGVSPSTEPDKPTGSDVVLYELATGNEFNLGNVSDFAFDKKGDWFAFVIDAQDKAGNGVQLRSMNSGTVQVLDSAKAVYKRLTWTEKGDGLTVLRGVEDKRLEGKLYSLVAFKDFGAATPTKIVFDPSSDKSFPTGMTISANRSATWRADFSAVIFGIQEVKTKKDAKPEGPDAEKKEADAKESKPEEAKPDPTADEPKPDLVIWHYKDPRLQSMQQVQESMDKNFSFVCAYVPSEKKFVRLANEEMRQVTMSPEAKYGVGIDVREYELQSNLDGRDFEDVYVVNPLSGEKKLALKKARWYWGQSRDGKQLLYYDGGTWYGYDAETGKVTDLTTAIPTSFVDTEDDHNVVKPPRQVLGWSSDSAFVLLSDGWDIWKVPIKGGEAVNLTVNGKKDKIRYRQRFRLDPEEKGIDLSAPMYVGAFGEFTKKGGLGLIEPGKPGVRMLQWGDAAFTRLMKAKNSDVYLYTRENTKEYPDFYLANKLLENGQRITEANPQQKDFLWPSGVRVLDYVSTKGDKLQAALWLPANYDPAKKYPAIVYIYEKLTQGTNMYPQPGYNGFSISNYTSNGYAVIEPDIVYKLNDPGLSAVACVVPAVKAAIASGVVDPLRVGIQGHSWGGYQTAFLVTQTDVFHAAVAGAPLTDMVSMYSLIYWNSGSTNQPIFESSQGRFTGGYWENMQAYIRNSPVFFAQNVKTPLMILHNDKDGAVDHTQGIEYFNTLRRMGKPVIMLEYKGENHGLRKPENMKDYTVRMREFFDHYLMDKPMAKWMGEGVPLLKMKDHLDERAKELAKPPAQAPVQAPAPAKGAGK